jgi:hypothetical protein
MMKDGWCVLLKKDVEGGRLEFGRGSARRRRVEVRWSGRKKGRLSWKSRGFKKRGGLANSQRVFSLVVRGNGDDDEH